MLPLAAAGYLVLMLLLLLLLLFLLLFLMFMMNDIVHMIRIHCYVVYPNVALGCCRLFGVGFVVVVFTGVVVNVDDDVA